MAERGQRSVVIVGASTAGLKCACRLARLRPAWPITVVEQRDTFASASCGLPYVLSGDVDDPAALRRSGDGSLRDERFFADVKGVTVRARTRAVAIDVARRRLAVTCTDGTADSLPFDDLVVATGATPRRLPGQPGGERVHAPHTVDDAVALRRLLAAGALGHVAVVGGGPAGVELAEALRALWGVRVTLLEAAPTPLAAILDDELGCVVAGALARNGVEVRCGAAALGVTADPGAATVRLAGGEVTADAAVIAIGAAPEVALAAAAGVAIGPTGAIAVSPLLATSVAGIWAAGDCAELRHAVTGEPCRVALPSLGTRAGRALAGTLAGRPEELPPVAGAMAVKAFDLNVAAVGMTRAAALARGLDARSVWVTAHDRAGFWPEAREIVLHLVYERGSGRVLGVQAVGEGEVCARIDVAAPLVASGATLADLAHVEHAFAPPYAPAVEPLVAAAWVAQNQEDGVVACSPVVDLAGMSVLDVRHPEELAARPCEGAELSGVPLESLREHAGELAGRPWVTLCERGGRAAEAQRLLAGHGQYLGGGLRLRAMARRTRV